MAHLWRHRDLAPDLGFPEWWRWRHGPPVRARVAGTSRYQDVLGRLRPYAGAGLPVALYPEPDNQHDPDAVAVIAGGWVAGYLRRDYAAIWQPVVLAEHAAGRVVTGVAQLTDTRWGTGLTVAVTQPSPVLAWEQPWGPPLPVGQAGVQAFWPLRNLTGKRRRQRRRAAARHRRALRACGIRAYGAAPMTATEARLNHYLAQCPEPFWFYPQVPFSRLRLDFYCPHARLCVEVDGWEHSWPERRASDRRRDRFLGNRGIITMRISNEQVDADPSGAAAAVLGVACQQARTLPLSDPASPFHGWLPDPPLRP